MWPRCCSARSGLRPPTDDSIRATRRGPTRESDPFGSVADVPNRTFTGELYLATDQPDAWVFVDLPEAVADEIDASLPGPRTAFGSVRVQVSLGPSAWQTSVFPSTSRATYVLPVRKAVRTAADVAPGDLVEITVTWGAACTSASTSRGRGSDATATSPR